MRLMKVATNFSTRTTTRSLGGADAHVMHLSAARPFEVIVRHSLAIAGLSVSSLLAAALLSSAAIAGSHTTRNAAVHAAADTQLDRALDSFFKGKPDAALEELDRLIARHPNFRLAHLVRGDVLLARTRPIAALGNTGHAAGERLTELRAEAHARFRSHKEAAALDKIPRYVLQLSPQQRHVIVVDAGSSRVYVYGNAGGHPRLIADYYSTIGRHGIEKEREGDKKTPVGVYHITAKIPGKQLPDLYGWGALPINYPNEWDRRLGRTGYGIWLHGVPSENYSRAPRASDGCVALANPDIAELSQRVQVGVTPVIIAHQLEWVSVESARAERDGFMRTFETWRASWESRDTERYLAHYARTFASDGMDRNAWQTHKRRVNAGKAWIKVSLSDLSAFRNPGKQPLIVVTFNQDYRSSTHSQQSRKRQYWVLENDRWKIAYEAELRGSELNLPESFRTTPRTPRLVPVVQRKPRASR
jgi:murein L,D-transpeptidase YafK